MQNINAHTCPECQQANLCQLAENAQATHCWCLTLPPSKSSSYSVPENAVCLCEKCLQRYKNHA